ncbi:hypothetical protein WDW37_02340 [Bdellovibrionota bacterium FG-1]
MDEGAEWIHLGAAEHSEAKRLKSALEDLGVELQILSDPESCSTGGCKPKLEIMVRKRDLEKVKSFFERERLRDLGELEHDQALADVVFDPEQENAHCPACGTEFSTKLTECPDCGLCFGG